MVDDKLGMGCGITGGWLSSSFSFPSIFRLRFKKKSKSKGNILIGCTTLYINFSNCYFNDYVERTNKNEKTN